MLGKLFAGAISLSVSLALLLMVSYMVPGYLHMDRTLQVSIFLIMAVVALLLWLRLIFIWRRNARLKADNAT